MFLGGFYDETLQHIRRRLACRIHVEFERFKQQLLLLLAAGWYGSCRCCCWFTSSDIINKFVRQFYHQSCIRLKFVEENFRCATLVSSFSAFFSSLNGRRWWWCDAHLLWVVYSLQMFISQRGASFHHQTQCAFKKKCINFVARKKVYENFPAARW